MPYSFSMNCCDSFGRELFFGEHTIYTDSLVSSIKHKTAPATVKIAAATAKAASCISACHETSISPSILFPRLSALPCILYVRTFLDWRLVTLNSIEPDIHTVFGLSGRYRNNNKCTDNNGKKLSHIVSPFPIHSLCHFLCTFHIYTYTRTLHNRVDTISNM